jgi:hypothetical protein
MALPKVDAAYRRAIEKARGDIAQIVRKEQATPLFIRLAFHDAMTHETGKTTGANGSIRWVTMASPPMAAVVDTMRGALGLW